METELIFMVLFSLLQIINPQIIGPLGLFSYLLAAISFLFSFFMIR
jgi:hypothetical protein